MRAGSSKALLELQRTLDSKHIFSGLTEKFVLSTLFRDPKSASKLPFVDAKNELAILRKPTKREASVQLNLKLTEPLAALPKVSAKAGELMQRPSVSPKELEHFLRTDYLAGIPPSEMREGIDRGLMDLTSASTPNNLRTLMQYIPKYWQVGLEGVRPSIYQARRQARTLLTKAIEVHPRTQYEGGGEQIGIPDFHKFEQFVHKFFEYFEVQRGPADELDDLLLRLCAKSGPLSITTSQIMGKSFVDELTLEIYLDAVKASGPSRDALVSMKALLLNKRTGPAATRFLLPYVQNTDDLFYLLDVVDGSSYRREVYDQCQTQVVRTLLSVELPPTLRIASLFGVLQRLKGVVPLTSSTLDAALEAALSAGSKPAVHRLLDESSHESDAVSRASKYVHRE